MLVVNEELAIPLRELRFSFSRSGGPGGQNVNKVASKATLAWAIDASVALPDDVRERFRARFARRISKDGLVLVTSQRYRDAGRNVADCLAKLRAMILEVAAPPRPRTRTRPSREARRRRLEEKRMAARKKELRRRPASDE
jgi:ribosome-associated protein